jgi:hypothetical protein
MVTGQRGVQKGAGGESDVSAFRWNGKSVGGRDWGLGVTGYICQVTQVLSALVLLPWTWASGAFISKCSHVWYPEVMFCAW